MTPYGLGRPRESQTRLPLLWPDMGTGIVTTSFKRSAKSFPDRQRGGYSSKLEGTVRPTPKIPMPGSSGDPRWDDLVGG
jgi:hypothetical protein